MRAASNPAKAAKVLMRTALSFCACTLLAATLAAQCSNPTTVPNQTISSGTSNYTDNNALSASSVVINGSASVTFVAGNCIQLLPGFHAAAGTAGTTFHAWVEMAPANVSILPASGSGFTQQFTWTASSPLGFANLSDLFALFNASVSGVNACYLHYNRASNLLSIANAAGTAWSSGIVPGGSGSTGGFNPYCTLNGSGSSVNASGTQLAVTASVTFQASFGGTWNDYLIAYDNEGLNTTWQQMGTWTVPAAPNFSLTLSCPQNMQVWVQSVCTVTAVPSGGFNQSINLALGIAPLVGGWLFDSPPAPLAPPNWTSPVHVTPEGGTGGWYEFQITGTSADHTISHTAPTPPVWNVDVTQTPAPLTITTTYLPGGQQGRRIPRACMLPGELRRTRGRCTQGRCRRG